MGRPDAAIVPSGHNEPARPLCAGHQRFNVTITVDDEVAFTHPCQAATAEAAAQFAVQVWMVGRDRSGLVGRRITATPTLIEEMT